MKIPFMRLDRQFEQHKAAILALCEQVFSHGIVLQGSEVATLEDQLCSWVPDVSNSPDRLDALVWGFTELMISGPREVPAVVPVSMTAPSQWRL